MYNFTHGYNNTIEFDIINKLMSILCIQHGLCGGGGGQTLQKMDTCPTNFPKKKKHMSKNILGNKCMRKESGKQIWTSGIASAKDGHNGGKLKGKWWAQS